MCETLEDRCDRVIIRSGRYLLVFVREERERGEKFARECFIPKSTGRWGGGNILWIKYFPNAENTHKKERKICLQNVTILIDDYFLMENYDEKISSLFPKVEFIEMLNWMEVSRREGIYWSSMERWLGMI